MLEDRLYISNITDESEKLVELFLDCYAQKSKATYANAIRRLRELVDKQDFTTLDYNDLMSCVNKYEKTNVLTCIFSFFQFLFSYDYLENTTGFENLYWNKKDRVAYFNKLKNRAKRKKSDYTPSLSLVDIEKLITFCDNVSPDDVDNLRLAFCFYLLFYEGFDASTLKGEVDANNYSDGYFKVGEQEYLLSDKYISLFEHLKDRTYSKFRSLNLYVNLLGKKVGITGLTPQIIKSARKNSIFMCPECGEQYLYFADNWKSINGKVVCSECAEKIIAEGYVKKNNNTSIIESYEVDIIDIEDKHLIKYATSTFDVLLSTLAFPTNFDELNMYLSKIGKLGEKFVFEKEKERLKLQGSKYWEFVDETPANDNRNGYDILSYTAKGEKIFIEVKTTTGDASQPFYMSKNELNKAKEIRDSGGKYQVHRVYHVTNKEEALFEIYEVIDEEHFIFDEILYKVTKK